MYSSSHLWYMVRIMCHTGMSRQRVPTMSEWGVTRSLSVVLKLACRRGKGLGMRFITVSSYISTWNCVTHATVSSRNSSTFGFIIGSYHHNPAYYFLHTLGWHTEAPIIIASTLGPVDLTDNLQQGHITFSNSSVQFCFRWKHKPIRSISFC
jgi:hypothetical protein